ncbi:MAG: hypothetical protein LBD07_01075, partial [Spirochaetaceae bacterium]|nr:hypothetical protein [Spirochaetaceae bacterium]
MVIYQTSAQADKTARAHGLAGRYRAAQTALALIAAAAVCMTAACTIEGESDDDGRSPRPGVPV